ncbi:MAG: 3-methyl-2-oxobutanoate hydroxymethyltransferase [Acidobacteriota bacterium]|nr:3-methyl-2-oxobutanoate hydroxymethyltransferase [Acidobacteriota bacterium]
MSNQTTQRVTAVSLSAKKRAGEKITVLTAYDYPTAKILDEAGVDIILVGDSLGMTVLGYENTIPVTMEDMAHHARAVARAAGRALIVCDMPYLSFHISEQESVRNAARLVKEAGVHAVKIEGATPRRAALVEALVEAEIPVMGHVGLTPQSINRFGRYRVLGGEAAEAKRIIEDALNLEKAGAFAVVLESVPLEVARMITERLAVPTIGIGAGPHCDGQVLVFHDLVGYTGGYMPKFVRKYADLHAVIGKAVGDYVEDVRRGAFPDDVHSYHLKPEAAAELAGGTGEKKVSG